MDNPSVQDLPVQLLLGTVSAYVISSAFALRCPPWKWEGLSRSLCSYWESARASPTSAPQLAASESPSGGPLGPSGLASGGSGPALPPALQEPSPA